MHLSTINKTINDKTLSEFSSLHIDKNQGHYQIFAVIPHYIHFCILPVVSDTKSLECAIRTWKWIKGSVHTRQNISKGTTGEFIGRNWNYEKQQS